MLFTLKNMAELNKFNSHTKRHSTNNKYLLKKNIICDKFPSDILCMTIN